MLLTTLSLFHLAAGVLTRDQRDTVFSRAALPGPGQLRRYGLALAAIVAVTAFDVLQRIVGTTGLTFAQWCACIGIAASLVVLEELTKLAIRRRGRTRAAAPPQPRLRTVSGRPAALEP
jgi:P-type Ca2+ transporter type 2C